MNILGNIARFFFQKRSNDFDANETFRRNQTRYNALYALDPNVLVRHLEAFQRGDICGLMRILEEFEMREDKMRIGSFKMSAAVSSKPWEVRVNKGEEENPRAKLHQEHLTKFWNRIETTDAFCRNRKGGLRLLVKQMMAAQSRVYSVHDIVWKVNGDGTLTANFTHVPAWCFENRTGRLRYIRNDGETHGEEMRDGEWLVTVGEGVGIPAAILAMAKRLSWNDWLLFSEKCGMPVVVGKTPAPIGSTARQALARAIRSVAPKTGLVADLDAQMEIVSLGANGGPATYRALVDVVDRAISALYRGGDLATVSGGQDAAGVNAQEGESELMDADGCAMVSETLRDQVEKFVIRFECGDFEPLAGIVVNPPAETEDIDREMKIDNHLAGLGVKLSKKDALARYGRTEAESDEDALKPPAAPVQGGFGGLANERTGKTPLQTRENALQNAPRGSDGQGHPQAEDALVEALEGLFEKSLAEAASGELGGEGLTRRRGEAESAEEVANEEDAEKLANMREYKRERDGKFAEVDHPRDFNPGDNPDSAETQAAEVGKGRKAVERCLAEKVDVPNAVSRGDVGLISLRYGDEKSGLAHFKSRADVVQHLSDTLVRGKAGKPYQQGQKLNIENAGYVATLALTNSPEHSGYPKNWVLTSFGPKDKKAKGAD